MWDFTEFFIAFVQSSLFTQYFIFFMSFLGLFSAVRIIFELVIFRR